MLKELVHSGEFRLYERHAPARSLIRGRTRPAAKGALLGRAALFGAMAVASITAFGWLAGVGPHPLLVVSVFSGALVAGLAGFAFSAVAAALLVHSIPPIAFVPLLLACSITTQLFSIAKLWRTMQWQRCAPFVAGGLAGIPVG